MAFFPAAIHDCKIAIRWLRAHAAEYHINPEQIGVTGFSSGGHLAALLGTSGGDKYLEGKSEYLEYSSRVQTVIDHFKEDSPESLFLGGPLREKTELARLANPITYVGSEDPPVLIGHG